MFKCEGCNVEVKHFYKVKSERLCHTCTSVAAQQEVERLLEKASELSNSISAINSKIAEMDTLADILSAGR